VPADRPHRPDSALTPDQLLRSAAHNHRSWFRRHARHMHGSIERIGGAELMIERRNGTVPFTGTASDVDAVVAHIRKARLRQVSWWSLRPDNRLGASLVARGFGWGWEPHWMARALDSLPDGPPVEVTAAAARGPYSDDLPYAPRGTDPPATLSLGIQADGRTVGRVAVNTWRGIAGIYSMGVSEAYRRRGFGAALTIAACRVAAAQGCTHAVLNATEEGEALYRAIGFRSLGWGQTWWWFPGEQPTTRQVALAEAIGTGDLEALSALAPSHAELRARLPGDTSPLRLAVLTNQLAAAEWMLEHTPALAQARFEPFGGTFLHLAVDSRRAKFVELGLTRGVDPNVRDRAFKGTPLGWAKHFANEELVALLRST
jgi:ribosomal protein S18 acetylase RimI-like enzyme